jgi:hypothetical protein
MSAPDYYAILQVHPEAEGIVIEAAYRRLARAYHPDVNRASNAHDRMVLLNEAFEVLSDAEQRRNYDRDRRRATDEHNSASERKETRSANASSQGDSPTAKGSVISPPIPPNPSDFGIDSAYWDRAVEGARVWMQRESFVPKTVMTSIRVSGWLAGGALFAFGLTRAGQAVLPLPALLWFCIPIGIESIIALLSTRHDTWLRNTVIDPIYNPAPDAYGQFAQEYAWYEAEFTTIYVARTGYRFHGNQFCGTMNDPFELPKYEATAKGYTPCSRCGHIGVKPRLLPPPFGRGPEPPPVAKPTGDVAPPAIRDRRPMWFVVITATAAIIAYLAWFAIQTAHQPPSFASSPVPAPRASQEVAMEDFSKLTREQIDNLEAERDFAVDDDSASSSTTPNLSELPTSDGHAAVKSESSQKDLIPAQPDGFKLEPINQTGLPPHPHQAAKNPVGGSNVNPKASQPSIDSQLAALDEQSRRTTADRLRRLGYEADWHVMSELQMLEIEARITTRLFFTEV